MWHALCVNQAMKRQSLWFGLVGTVAASPAHAGALAAPPDPGNYALLALGLTGLAIGWLGARGPRRD
jgi:hypothetical protein